jgi:hypothetical protein
MRRLSDDEIGKLGVVVGVRGPGSFQARYTFWDGATVQVYAKGATWDEAERLDVPIGPIPREWPLYLLENGEKASGVVFICFAPCEVEP